MKSLKDLINLSNNYVIYHNSFSLAVKLMEKFVKSNGYLLDEDDVYREITTGAGRPRLGKTNKYHLHLVKNGAQQKKLLHAQVYCMGNRFLLNMYIN